MATRKLKYSWSGVSGVSDAEYQCGFCGNRVGPSLRYQGGAGGISEDGKNLPGKNVDIFICPVCSLPTFFDYDRKQIPAVRLGAEITQVPTDGLKQLYDEARDCTAAGAYTACVMVCRKILMNLAVREGAQEGESFVSYVTYLGDQGYVPPKGKAWIDKIRRRGNDANHQIALMSADDAAEVLKFVEALLRYNFELTA